jgi:hypothetical protein
VTGGKGGRLAFPLRGVTNLKRIPRPCVGWRLLSIHMAEHKFIPSGNGLLFGMAITQLQYGQQHIAFPSENGLYILFVECGEKCQKVHPKAPQCLVKDVVFHNKPLPNPSFVKRHLQLVN